MTAKRRILIVEDDDDMRLALQRCLQREGCEVVEARDGQEGCEKLQGGLDVEMVITDLEMPRASGREVLVAGIARGIPVVVLTAHGTVSTAVELMRKGAANFLTKPFSPPSLRALLEDAFGRPASTPPKKERVTDPRMSAVIGEEAPFRSLLETVQAVAETDATVLITGESGTGKEVMARTLHAFSKRADAPFVAVNCGAIPEALLESELFGHAKGAFTGATQSRAGRFQLAEHGTLFLDEIGDMPLPFQVKLLRVLQERQVEVLGESVSRPIDVRIICATHRDLAKMAQEGTFREDLFYRLNVIDLHLPPLRERRGDIALLVDHFRDAAAARHSRPVTGVAADAMVALTAYAWPGNVRELANAVERMVILKRSGELTMSDLPAHIVSGQAAGSQTPAAALPAQGIDLRQAVASYEESLIEQALSRTRGNRNAAAQLLGLNRTTLVEKLRRMHKE